MEFDAAHVGALLESFDFPRLFVEELGWDHHTDRFIVTVAGAEFALEAVAVKRGAVAWLSRAPAGTSIPERTVRQKVDQEVTKRSFEHLVIFVDDGRAAQVWSWPRREYGRPVALVDHTWRADSQNTAFIQRLHGISFRLEEENELTLPQVAARLDGTLNAERVTKRFYDQFKTEHQAFLNFIEGITEVADREWYASLMLNRLMFVYFMQKKGFLDGEPDYLRKHLDLCQRERGKGSFHSFYRYFLLRLFHQGLGGRDRNPELDVLLGRIPYLNGGLFEIHPIEESCPDIKIPDEAFERIFAYFDRYKWHLDERPLRDDTEINPDVLGYIFEKYINQKQMGAYYTKEDITEYITKSTVIPFLFNETKKECTIAFVNPVGPTIWDHLKEDPDRYIYDAVKKGVALPLPDGIAAGIGDVTARGEWNRPAPADFALPTEIWREVMARRGRYAELRQKLAAGEVREINDLITLNLDIRQFAQDVIERCEGPELLRAFWKAIERVTVLDPTCGSGAFLFAALNILEALYETCLSRMEAFVADVDRTGPVQPGKEIEDFRTTLAKVRAHPNTRYFTLKNIILNNLFGVDIMEEAVEICKLRMFLKLAAQVEPDRKLDNLGIEPLPDIDFNIRAGNTLVGYANYADVKNALTSKLDLDNASDSIAASAADLQKAADTFRARQMEGDGSVPAADKARLRERISALEHQLNAYLASEYGVRTPSGAPYARWRQSFQPFHWFIEFHGIMQRGGFDVVVGNPPYIQRSKITNYSLLSYATNQCPDIYAPCIERSLAILKSEGRIGLIVPISFQFSNEFRTARQIVAAKSDIVWASTFSRNPAALFSAGLGVRSTIFLAQRLEGPSATIYTSRLYRWVEEGRDQLFEGITYTSLPKSLQDFGWPRLDNEGIKALFEKIVSGGGKLISISAAARVPLRFKSTALYYLSIFATDPPSFDGRGRQITQPQVGQIKFRNEAERDRALAIALSKISLIWWSAIADDFHVTAKVLGGLPVSPTKFSESDIKFLDNISVKIKTEMANHIIYTNYAGKRMGNYDIKNIRHLTDEVDHLILRSLNMPEIWDDIELAYARFMKMTRERHGTTRGNMGDLDGENEN